MTWYQILTLIGIPTLGSLIVTYIFNSVANSKKAKENRKQEFAEAMEKENAVIKKALQALLRDRLYERYFAAKEKGFATITQKHNFENMYQQYHALGVNGVMDNLYNEFMELPIPTHLDDNNNNQIQ